MIIETTINNSIPIIEDEDNSKWISQSKIGIIPNTKLYNTLLSADKVQKVGYMSNN